MQHLITTALEMAKNISNESKFEIIVNNLQRFVNCDAAAILKLDGEVLVPLAARGLSEDVIGRRFSLPEHPRFGHITRNHKPTFFPANSPLPDPYDGLVEGHEGKLKVHSCMGLPLWVDGELVGIITIDALKPGAFDRLETKVFESYAALAATTLKNALLLEKLDASLKNQQWVSEALIKEQTQQHNSEIIGNSPAVLQLKREIAIAAPSDLTVLVTGETGTGKELVATNLHVSSPRFNKPLIHVNCAALPESVAESELFGHAKGAFTGADTARGGKFEVAHQGTLFLDEVGELSLVLQAKLLRALQSGEIQRVGEDIPRKVDVRIVAATNRNLKQAVDAGEFRADLYHRLSVYPIHIPPLKERIQDIRLLAGYFAERYRITLNLRSLALDKATTGELEHYDWPGNVRELEHVIGRAALKTKARSDGDMVIIEPEDLLLGDSGTHEPRPPQSAFIEQGLTEATQAFQKSHILKALQANSGNWSQTAIQLKLDRSNLHRLAKRLGIKK